jgi:hypothetical protein
MAPGKTSEASHIDFPFSSALNHSFFHDRPIAGAIPSQRPFTSRLIPILNDPIAGAGSDFPRLLLDRRARLRKAGER